MENLKIHEAIPGTYTQLIYSNQSPSIIKTILGNGAMVEGWAVQRPLFLTCHQDRVVARVQRLLLGALRTGLRAPSVRVEGV